MDWGQGAGPTLSEVGACELLSAPIASSPCVFSHRVFEGGDWGTGRVYLSFGYRTHELLVCDVVLDGEGA